MLKCPVAPVVRKPSVIFSPQSNHSMQMEAELVMSKASCKCPFQMPQTVIRCRDPWLCLHPNLHAWPNRGLLCQVLKFRWNGLCNPMISCLVRSAALDVECVFGCKKEWYSAIHTLKFGFQKQFFLKIRERESSCINVPINTHKFVSQQCLFCSQQYNLTVWVTGLAYITIKIRSWSNLWSEQIIQVTM